MRHILGLEQLVEFVLREPTLGDDEVVNTSTGLKGFFGNSGGLFVTQNWIKSGDKSDGVLDKFKAALAVGLDAVYTPGCEHNGGVTQKRKTEEKVKRDNRLGHV